MQPGRTTPAAEETISRRDGLRRLAMQAAIGYSAVATSGCAPFQSASEAELIWGRRGLSEGRFLKPRAISIDRFDQLYICDTTGRIQVFDRDGNWLRQWSTPETANGRPTGMTMWQPDPDGAPEDDLLLVADKYCLADLKKFCESQVPLSSGNVVDALVVADQINSEKLMIRSKAIFRSSFDDLMQTDGAVKLKCYPGLLLKLLSHYVQE